MDKGDENNVFSDEFFLKENVKPCFLKENTRAASFYN